MKKFWFYIGLMWKPTALSVVLLAIVAGLLFFQLNSLVPNHTSKEVQQFHHVQSGKNIFRSPINAPLNVPQYLLIKLRSNNIQWMRISTSAIAILSILCIFLLSKAWHTSRIAYLASILYASSSWFLITARTGTPDILLTLIPGLFLVRVWLHKTQKRRMSVLISLILGATILYIPGGVWFLGIALVWRRSHIIREFRTVPLWYMLVCSGTALLVVVPLILAGIHNLEIFQLLAGLPTSGLSVVNLAHNLINTLAAVFVRTNNWRGITLGSTALLDAFTAVMCIAGIYAYIKRIRLDRSKILIFGAIGSLVLTSLGGEIYISVLLPFIYLFVAAGLAWMLQQWFAVFPRNPVARNFGFAILSLAVAMSAIYNGYRYFVAWPHIPATKQVYNQRV